MFNEIKTKFSGEFYVGNTLADKAMRRVYATDASEYQEMPLAVAIPKTQEDIQNLIYWAVEHQQTLIPRAAGTSLAGQVVGSGVVVDVSKHFTKILEVNTEEKWVRVQMGVIRDDLNAYLKPYRLMFGPETSTANRAMIGGMIGNNSCGLHSIVWGTTRDNLLEVKALLHDGSEVTFQNLNQTEYQQKQQEPTIEGGIYRKINALLSDTANQKAIREGFPAPDIKRRNTGYALDFLLDSLENTGGLNLCQLVAGSEGTLCVLVEAKLRLQDLPPAAVGMVAIHAHSINEALLANLVALESSCSASELVDDFILQFTKINVEQSKNRFFVEGDPNAILMVEFFAETEIEVQKRCETLIHDLKNQKLGYAYPILLGDDCKKAWDLRKAGLGLLRNVVGDAKPVNLIEDCAVSPKDLPDYIKNLEIILKKYNVQYSMYAHAGAGELHVEPIINLKTDTGRKTFRNILEETATLVKSYKGSLSGEHGDGRLRGEFIPMMMGEENYALFREIKQTFDPKGIFNRAKIVDTQPMDKFLRYAIDAPTKTKKTIFDFEKQGGFLRLAEKCSGSGDCRKTEITGGTMCPSFMASRSERDTTRARANILRQYLSNEQPEEVSKEEVKDILDLCLSCKACQSECPSSVDMSKMKAEFMQSYYDDHGLPLRTRLIANFSAQMRLAGLAPQLFNLVFGTPILRKIAYKFIGFHPQRSMPQVATQTLRAWWAKQTKGKSGKIIYVFCDEFTNYTDTEAGKKMLLLMQSLGYQPEIIAHQDSGRSYLSKGLVREAQRLATKNVEIFGDLISEETPLVGIEPSAILSFRDEYRSLVPEPLRQSAENIAKHTLLFEEWFAQEVKKGAIRKESFHEERRTIKLHGHCHQKAMSSLTPAKQALSLPQNYEVQLINSGCCGMAGSFGYEKEHFETSMQVGELVLLPTIRQLEADTLIAAAGTSCRHQIKDGTTRTAQHPAEILFDALKAHISA